MAMKTIDINGTWKLRGREQESENASLIEISASVPGLRTA